MKSKFLVFVLLISFIGLIECEPPQLNVPDELVFIISPNGTNGTTESDFEKFELTCSGEKPVQWSTKVRKLLLLLFIFLLSLLLMMLISLLF
ncbi:UNVERIFIED_CONTAM: hypothetical protein RMT77_018137 [Armadillidium vulgare]